MSENGTPTALDAERQRIKEGLDFRLNERLCEMEGGWDDSITGFNDAWDVVKAYFAAQPSGRPMNRSPDILAGEPRSQRFLRLAGQVHLAAERLFAPGTCRRVSGGDAVIFERTGLLDDLQSASELLAEFMTEQGVVWPGEEGL